MSVQVEKLEKNMAKLTIEVAAEDFEKAVQAAYMKNREADESLSQYLEQRVFAGMKAETVEPDREDAAGFDAYTLKYTACLAAQKAAVEALR